MPQEFEKKPVVKMLSPLAHKIKGVIHSLLIIYVKVISITCIIASTCNLISVKTRILDAQIWKEKKTYLKVSKVVRRIKLW